MGSLAAGGAATIGTGAFTSVEANRDVAVEVADDSDAFLSIEPTDGSNDDYTVINGDGTIGIDLTNSNPTGPAGSGVNGDATTNIQEIFTVRNQGTQPVLVFVPPYSGVQPRSVSAFDDDGSRASGTIVGPDNPGVYIDPQFANFGDQPTAPNAPSYSLTGVYGSALPTDVINSNYVSDVSGMPSGGGYTEEEMTLGVGESFDFGLNIQQYGQQSFPSNGVTLTLTAAADLT